MTFSESASSARISISVGSLKLERAELTELQNPFERSSMYEGLGLEVPLVRHIVRAHGGFLEVDLRADGSGVSFGMVFPNKI
jgi:C4-dicarboxylate-specific signal transduction histidine kinase